MWRVGSDGAPGDAGADNAIVVVLPDTLVAGRPAQAVATTGGSGGEPLVGTAVSWTSSDSTIARVSDQGVVEGRAVGGVRIIATVGTASGSTDTRVVPGPAASVALSPPIGALLVEDSLVIEAVAMDSLGNRILAPAVQWGTLPETLASVDPSGRVLGLTSGTVFVTAQVGDVIGRAALTVLPAVPESAASLVSALEGVATASDPAAELQALLPELEAIRSSAPAGTGSQALQSLTHAAFRDISPELIRAMSDRLGGSLLDYPEVPPDQSPSAAPRLGATDPVLRLVAINGINTVPSELDISFLEIVDITRQLGWGSWLSGGGYRLSRFYNPSGVLTADVAAIGVLEDLYEALQQLLQATTPRVTNTAAQLADLIDTAHGQRQQVLLVPHSQGNLMAFEALKRVALPECVGVVSIASPLWEGWPPATALRGVVIYDPPAYDLIARVASGGAPPRAPFAGVSTVESRLGRAAWPLFPEDVLYALRLHEWDHYLRSAESRAWIRTALADMDAEVKDRCGRVVVPGVVFEPGAAVLLGVGESLMLPLAVVNGAGALPGRTVTSVESVSGAVSAVLSPDGRGVQLTGEHPGGSTLIFWSGPARGQILVNVGGAPAIDTQSLPDGTVDAAYQEALAASGGLMPYAWSLVSGALPSGLELTTDGVIRGTPTTPDTATFTVRVTGADGRWSERDLTIDVAGPAWRVFRYQGHELTGGLSTDPILTPGPISITVTFTQPVPAGFSGGLTRDHVERIVLESAGVGVIDAVPGQYPSGFDFPVGPNNRPDQLEFLFEDGEIVWWEVAVGRVPIGTCSTIWRDPPVTGWTTELMIASSSHTFHFRISSLLDTAMRFCGGIHPWSTTSLDAELQAGGESRIRGQWHPVSE